MVYEKIHGSYCHDCQPGRLSVGELHRAMWKKSVAVVKCVFIKRTRILKMWFDLMECFAMLAEHGVHCEIEKEKEELWQNLKVIYLERSSV